MTAVSAQTTERSRKAHSLVLQRISEVGQSHIADQIGVSAATVSRFVSDDLERACQLVIAAGLKIVPGEMKCFSPRKVEILLELARDHLNQIEAPEQLQWD